MKYITIKDCAEYNGVWEIVGKHMGASSWDVSLTLRKVHNIEEHLAWAISEAACALVYAHRSAPSNIPEAKARLIQAIKELENHD